MDESHFDRIQHLFLTVLGLPAEQRESWLIKQCGDDFVLLEEIRSLLKHDSPLDDPLERQLDEVIADVDGFAQLELEAENAGQPRPTALHVRCPHCHNPMELIEETPLADIDCPSCGSKFSLLGEDTLAHPDDRARMIAHFQLQEMVGTGGFGSVWKAHDETLDRIVAIKIPRKGQLNREESELFLREARSAAQLKHANIVSVHEVGRDDGQIYIVSDFVEGVSLSSWLTRKPLTFHEGARLTAKIAEALHHAHEAGVIHRDLKPTNIMIDDAGEPHLLDFGLAKREAGEITMTADGKVLGTPAYMSPEQARGEASRADRRSDVYSMGVILFEILTGEKPFRGDLRMLLQQVISEEAPRLRQLRATVPLDLETICLKCLQKNPTKRYATASDLSEDLNRYLQGRPITARPISSIARIGRWCRRNSKLTLLMAAVAMLLIIVAIGSVWSVIWIDAERTIALSNERDATANAREAQRQEQLAKEQRRDAKQQRSVATSRLIRMQLSNGVKSLEEQDAAGALLWFTDALAEAASSGKKQDIHRIRVANFASECPHPIAIERRIDLQHKYRAEVERIDSEAKQSSLQEAPDVAQVTILNDRTNQRVGVPIRVTHSIDDFGCFYSADGSTLVTRNGDTAFQVWNAKTGQAISPVIRPEAMFSGTTLAISPDGRVVQARTSGRTRFLDSATGKLLYEIPSYIPTQFSPSGKFLVEFGRKNFVVRQADTGRIVSPVSIPDAVVASSYQDQAVVFSPDESRLALPVQYASIGIVVPSSVWILNLATGESVDSALQGVDSTSMIHSFSPDGRWLLTSGTELVQLWNVVTGAPMTEGLRHAYPIQHASFSPDGRLIATATLDDKVEVWRIQSRDLQIPLAMKIAYPPLRHSDAVMRVEFNREGDQILARAAGDERIWSFPDVRNATRAFGDGAAFSRDGRRAVVFPIDESKPCLMDLASRSLLTPLSDEAFPDAGGLSSEVRLGMRGSTPWLRRIVLSDDGSMLLTIVGIPSKGYSSTVQSRLQLWSTKTGESICGPMEQDGQVLCAAISPSGEFCAVYSRLAGFKSAFRIYQIADGSVIDCSSASQQIGRFGQSGDGWNESLGSHVELPIIDLMFTTDSKRVIAVGIGTIAQVDVASGLIVGQPHDFRHGGGGTSRFECPQQKHVDMTNDGKKFVVAAGNRFAQVWDAATFRPISKSISHQDKIRHITLAAAGDWFATASADGTARVWDAGSGQPVSPAVSHQGGVDFCSFSPDGRLLVTTGRDKMTQVWEIATGIPVIPAITHDERATYVAFTPDGKGVVTSGPSGVSIREISSTDKPIDDLVKIAEVLAGGSRIDMSGSLSRYGRETVAAKLQELQITYPDEFDRYRFVEDQFGVQRSMSEQLSSRSRGRRPTRNRRITVETIGEADRDRNED